MGVTLTDVALAIARAATATAEPTSATFRYPISRNFNIEPRPNLAKFQSNIIRYPHRIEPYGYELPWFINNQEVTAALFGYQMWLALGGDAYAAFVQTLTPTDEGQYMNVLIDDTVDKGTSTPTERLIGSKVSHFDFEFRFGSPAVFNMNGLGCNYGTIAAALVPTFPSGVDNAPLSWQTLKAVGAFVKVGLNGAATAQDDTITRLKVSGDIETKPHGADLGHTQPQTMRNGGAFNLTFELDKEFGTKAEYEALKLQQTVELEFKAVIGANYVTMYPIRGYLTEKYRGEGGSGADPVPATLVVDCFKNGTADLIKFDVKDGSTAAYT